MVVGRIAATARLLLIGVVLLGCGGQDVGPSTGSPGEPLVLTAREVPPDIATLLSTSASDSCGVCERENQADAFELTDAWLAPGTIVRPTADRPLRVLDVADHELVLAAPADTTTPRLTFRFHTSDEHLIGIAPEDFTDAALADAVLADASRREVELVVVPFAYGEGAGFLFDASRRRIQVQCRLRPIASD